MAETLNQWRLFWRFVRSERIITIRFFGLVATLLFCVALVVAAVIMMPIFVR